VLSGVFDKYLAGNVKKMGNIHILSNELIIEIIQKCSSTKDNVKTLNQKSSSTSIEELNFNDVFGECDEIDINETSRTRALSSENSDIHLPLSNELLNPSSVVDDNVSKGGDWGWFCTPTSPSSLVKHFV